MTFKKIKAVSLSNIGGIVHIGHLKSSEPTSKEYLLYEPWSQDFT